MKKLVGLFDEIREIIEQELEEEKRKKAEYEKLREQEKNKVKGIFVEKNSEKKLTATDILKQRELKNALLKKHSEQKSSLSTKNDAEINKNILEKDDDNYKVKRENHHINKKKYDYSIVDITKLDKGEKIDRLGANKKTKIDKKRLKEAMIYNVIFEKKDFF